jgi:hypothetical protein
MLERRKMNRRKPNWLEDAKGADSILRLCVLIAVIMGCIICVVALYGFLKETDNTTIVLGAGTGLITLVLTLKVWQRQVEEKGVADTESAEVKVTVAKAEVEVAKAEETTAKIGQGAAAESNAALLQKMDEPGR